MLRPHYSGKLSRKFWDAVNRHDSKEQKKKGDKTVLYFSAVLLQDIESTILRHVNRR